MKKSFQIILILMLVFAGTTWMASGADKGKVTITSPEENQVFKTGKVTVEWFVDLGKEGDHVHLYLDGKLIGREYRNSYTFENLKPGAHTIELRLATKWFSEPGPKADVTIEVRGKG